jgi:CDP-paratose 2-epimerase
MYGVTKLTSEYLALEYSSSYGFPVWVNRCGVLSGEGQFGISSQGIVSFWIAMLMAGRDLVYTGQGGKGFQVRDLLHPIDLARLIVCQIEKPQTYGQLYNVSGGISSSFSLFELTEYCRKRGFGEGVRSSGDNRINDVPHVVLDSSKVENCLNWSPAITTTQIFDRVIKFMEENPNWLRVSGNLR